MSSEGGDKTEEPTQKKIDDSRKKGQVWKSRDLTAVAVFIAGMALTKAMWPYVEYEVKTMFAYAFDQVAHSKDLERSTLNLMVMALRALFILAVPIALGCAVGGALLDFLQVGPLFAPESLMPKFDKLNPLGGLKNMFSKKQLVELVKSILKISITAYVVWGVVRDAMPMVVATIRGDTEMTLAVLGELVYRVSVRTALLFLLFGIFDVWFQHKTYMKDMMMSKDEVKREYKESEGDPHHKAKRKELHMEILEGAQMEAVKKSNVVVTNPDHLAIALLYDKDKDNAPRVVAKGFDARAEKIRELAREGEVPLVRNVPLAQALFRLEVNDEIPEELYDAVAEVMNFVYGLQAKLA